MSPAQTAKGPSFRLPGSPLVRVIYISVILIILLVVIKSLTGQIGKSNFTPYIGIAQEQQAMVHLVTNAGDQDNLTPATQNFAATAQFSLTSSRNDITQYLLLNHQKVDPKILGLKISASTDEELTNAGSAGTYDQTFQTIMKDRLTTYTNSLKKAYLETKGKKGHDLLNDDYNQAQLLLTQLGQAATQPQ